MSFAQKTEKLVEDLVQAEYQNACTQFGEKYNSLHEGYAVLLEEVEEADKEMSFIKDELCRLWTFIKGTRIEGWIETSVKDLIKENENAMKELAQVGAVLKKIRNTIGEVKE